jgi:two-component system, cell cycle sensor histidine kinase and response regulator CckA
VTDILMRQMNGKDLASRVSSILPYLTVLFGSAYSAAILDQHDLCPKGADVVKKPFTGKTLLSKIDALATAGHHWIELVQGRRGSPL